jgi:hypothetical protein
LTESAEPAAATAAAGSAAGSAKGADEEKGDDALRHSEVLSRSSRKYASPSLLRFFPSFAGCWLVFDVSAGAFARRLSSAPGKWLPCATVAPARLRSRPPPAARGVGRGPAASAAPGAASKTWASALRTAAATMGSGWATRARWRLARRAPRRATPVRSQPARQTRAKPWRGGFGSGRCSGRARS